MTNRTFMYLSGDRELDCRDDGINDRWVGLQYADLSDMTFLLSPAIVDYTEGLAMEPYHPATWEDCSYPTVPRRGVVIEQRHSHTDMKLFATVYLEMQRSRVTSLFEQGADLSINARPW